MKPNFRSEMQFGSNLPVCNTSQLQEHEKEKIKNILIQQEATFKHQVSELHRVYRKQRKQQELMDEIKMISPNSIIASSLKDTKLLPSSSNVLRKRTIDLELPADEYIDHDEGRFVDGTVDICTTQGLNWLTDKIGILDHRAAHALTVSKMNWSAQSEIFKNGVYPKYQIDLNSSPNAADINLEPRVSQENKESSPPRGNSMEKQPAESVELTAQDEKCQKYLVLRVAKALVLISSNSATSSGLPKRKRTKRTNSQKEIRGDILPHITSQSRQENEGNANKNERERGKQQAYDTDLLYSLECLPGWGMKNIRHHRRPANRA